MCLINNRFLSWPVNMKKIMSFLWLLCVTGIMSGQDTTWGPDPVANRFIEEMNNFPHEKIYVQTDKSTYISGERVWLRAHLVDATSNRPAFVSRYIYLELFNPFDELMKRVKIRPDSVGVYSGYIDLEEDLAEGDYTLRAYTRYMRNQGNDAFHKKRINVLDPYSLQIEPIPNFRINNNKIDANFRFVDRVSKDTIAPEIVTMKLADETTRTIAPTGETDYNWSFSLPKKRSNRTLLLGIVHEGRVYNRYYAIPYAADDFDVSFHPEGGYLVPGHTCRVGFKALNPSGFGESIAGKVYNSANEEVTTFTTYRLGMGSFHLSVKPGETYYAVCETKNGAVKRIDLPAAEPRARTVRVRRAVDQIVATLLKGESAPDDPVSLLVHNKGLVLYHEPWASETGSYAFPESIFPSGVISFLLLDDQHEILSERLIFNTNDNDIAKLEAELSSPAYKRREKITLSLQLPDLDTVSFYNNLAISVTDKNTVALDTTNNLIATLLLSSELQGYIESPASYFTGSKTDPLALDALMTTQGWRRYDVPGVLKGKISTPDSFLPEQFQEISGKTEALLRSMKDGEISLIATLDSLVSTVTTTASSTGLVTAQDIEERKISSLRSLLTSTPGIIMRPDRVTTTRSDLPVIFVIDDIPYENFFDQLDGLDVSAIDNLFIMRDNTSMLGYYPGTDGAVVITTKKGFVQTNTLSKNIDRFQPLGYQQAAEFYSPKYATPEQLDSPEPDFRTTIYWKPDVQFSRSGEAVVEFYSADTPTTYQVVGEGITGFGKMIRFTKDIAIENGSNP